jgi:hypothetical protein
MGLMETFFHGLALVALGVLMAAIAYWLWRDRDQPPW